MKQRSVLDSSIALKVVMKKAKLEKSHWVTVKKKPGPKKVEKSFDEAKEIQLAESDKGSWYNQSDFL